MESYVLLSVLAAAACHAGWNALLKLRVEPIVAISLMTAACGVVALPFIPFTGLPAAPSWPYIVASLVLHLGYYTALAEAYRFGELGQVYPIARGTAPLLTAIATQLLSAERLPPVAWVGMLVLSCGILVLSFAGSGSRDRFDLRSVGFALLTAATISAYTIVDGTGARIAGTAAPYIAWLLLLDGLMMLAFGLLFRRQAFIAAIGHTWGLALAGGAMSAAAYGIAIWAMTVAPIAMVAAVRETSVLFAALIAIYWLKEPVRPVRLAAVGVAFCGVLMLRLA